MISETDDVELESQYVEAPKEPEEQPSDNPGGGNSGGNSGGKSGGYTPYVPGGKSKKNTPAASKKSTAVKAAPQAGPSYTVGMVVQTSDSKGVYKVSKVSGNVVELVYVKPAKKTYKSVNIPANVKLSDGTTAKVTSIAANAFKGMKKLKSVTIGASISSIGKSAFSGCKNLKKITVKTSLLGKKSVGKSAFKGIAEKAVFKCPKKKKASYKKIFKKAGAPKKAKYK